MKPSTEIITPARSRDLTTIATVKEEFEIDGTENDARWARWIREASSTIEDYTRRVWAQETVIDTFHIGYPANNDWYRPFINRHWSPNRHPPLCLSRYPVSALTSVTVDGNLLDTTEFLLDAAEGLLYRLTADGAASIVWYGGVTAVTYTGGYELLDDLPSSVEQACLRLLHYRFMATKRDPALRSIEVPGVQSESYFDAVSEYGAVTPEVAGLLDKHIDMRS